MEAADGKAAQHEKAEAVRVAVNIRPLVEPELLNGCTDCITVVPGEPQVQIGAHSFTYDYVYGASCFPSSEMYGECIAPLVDAFFQGYNTTVLAYGQTGSGKTYTMGTNYSGDGRSNGIIPQVMDSIFTKVSETTNCTEYFIRVSFIEIFKEEVFDLLDTNSHALRNEATNFSKQPAAPRAPIQIRETPSGGIALAGVIEAEVNSKEEMASFLTRGSISRATGSTNMNSQSSRSHAIFTINMEQKRHTKPSVSGPTHGEDCDDIVLSKFHLVDLAGSERAKRTGADGLRLKEGIHINRGLLALGNVISALGDEKKRKDGGHVPYRDSKLTRLLQDSLGGNSKTVMIACVSPADTNAEETINTLKYANRARNIQNKAVVNHDPVAAQMQRMRSEIEQLHAELLFYRNGAAPSEELQVLRHKIFLLESSNSELHQKLKEYQTSCERLGKRALDAQVERDELVLKIESSRKGKSWNEIDGADQKQEVDTMRSYVSKIQDLETELLRLQSFSSSGRHGLVDILDVDDEDVCSKGPIRGLLPSSDGQEAMVTDVKELEHTAMQERLDRELQELDKQLELKEAEMKRVSKGDNSVLKHHYEKKIFELEHEKKVLQKEIEDLRSNIADISSASGDGAQKLKEEYLQKLTLLETQVSDLKKKQEAQSQLLRQKQKSDEAAKRLIDEIQRIKSQKVNLQHKIKHESEQFRAWKASREKEVLQLKKEGRRNEYEMHKLLSLNQRQKMVLQRKTEEAALATKRLKELLEAKKVSSRENSGNGLGNGHTHQALIHAINHELEVMLQVDEVRSKYEKQLKARSEMADELARLREEAERIKQQQTKSGCGQGMSPSARNSRISALENMLATSSSTLVSMASHLSEAEERERLFSGRTRWSQVRSLGDAKLLLNYLFGLASASKCQAQSKHAECQEKDQFIDELKEKIVRVGNLLRQSEVQKIEMEQKIQAWEKRFRDAATGTFDDSKISFWGDEGPTYELRKAPRKSQFMGTYLTDMDTSDSGDSDASHSDDDDWVESNKKKAGQRGKARTKGGRPQAEPADEDGASSGDHGSCTPQEGSASAEACCTCSKSSSCKTQKCECRAAGRACGASCGCLPSKCANGESHRDLVSQAASLLENALTDGRPSKPKEAAEASQQPRKALSDIGNTQGTAPKPRRRKNWRKSQYQLVPEPQPQPQHQPQAEQENQAAARMDKAVGSLRLPRAMAPAAEPLAQRNSADPAATPAQPPRPLQHDEKENNRLV
ncbi:P-loop containing nucleoside triphosphate hydrolases superfamily protein isoform X2 [Wolffia australiana]